MQPQQLSRRSPGAAAAPAAAAAVAAEGSLSLQTLHVPCALLQVSLLVVVGPPSLRWLLRWPLLPSSQQRQCVGGFFVCLLLRGFCACH